MGEDGDVEIGVSTGAEANVGEDVVPEKVIVRPGRFSEEMKTGLKNKNKGCSVFEFPEDISEEEEIKIKREIKYFGQGILTPDEEKHIFNLWPRGYDLAVKKGFSVKCGGKTLTENRVQIFGEEEQKVFSRDYCGAIGNMGTLSQYLALEYEKKKLGESLFETDIIRTDSTIDVVKDGTSNELNYVFIGGDIVDKWECDDSDRNLVVVPIFTSS